MSQDLRIMTPLDWRAVVAETLRRRKAEKMTQRRHAALAGVSIPTMIAFERGERTLSLAKAFDILRVVGLVDEPAGDGEQEAFVQAALARWRRLTDKLPADSPARFPHGFYRFDYVLEGEVKPLDLPRFREILSKAATRHGGWPVFWTPTREALAPREMDGAIECWLAPPNDGLERAFADAAHCDYWQASPQGRMFLIRGYQEDSQDAFPPGRIFDVSLPIWRIGEALLHAASLSRLMGRNGANDVTIRFRACFSGLLGRVLKSWANPLAEFRAQGMAARGDEAVLEALVPADEAEKNLAAHIYPLVASLYERFGVAAVSRELVDAEVAALVKTSARSRRSRPTD